MIHRVTDVPAVIAALCGGGGIVLGLLYFAALRRSVAIFTDGGGWFAPAALTLLRIAGIVIALGVAAKLGAIPVLAVFLGFLIARGISLRLAREAK
jgi:hypothetical protein